MRLRTKGFTLVELLIVVAIIALLIGILLPSLNKARAAAEQIACMSSMKQWHLANTMYAANYKDFIRGATAKVDDDNNLLGSWWKELASYFGNSKNVKTGFNKAGTAYNYQQSSGANQSAAISQHNQIGGMRCPTVADRYCYQLSGGANRSTDFGAGVNNETTISYVAVANIFSPTNAQRWGRGHRHPGASGARRMIKFFEVPHQASMVLYGDGWKNFRSNPSVNIDGQIRNSYPPTKQSSKNNGVWGDNGDTIYGAPLIPEGAQLGAVHGNQCNMTFVDGHGEPVIFPMKGLMYDSWDEGLQSNEIKDIFKGENEIIF